MTTLWLAIFAASSICCLLLSRMLMPLAVRWRMIDRPAHRKTHRKPVVYLGGVAVLLSVIGVVYVVRKFGLGGTALNSSWPALTACLSAAFAAACIGLWDDILDLRPRYKIVGQAIIAVLFSIMAYRFHALHIPGIAPFALGSVFSVMLTTFFILAIVNGFNMIDGSDGLCVGSVISSLLILAWVAQGLGQSHFVLLAIVTSGACLGFYFWNRSPARMYLGDAGSQGLGFMVACLLVALGNAEPGNFPALLPNGRPWQPYQYQLLLSILIVGYPAMEVTLTVLRRMLQGRALGRGDQGHLHHHFQRVGLSATLIVLCAVVFNLLSGGIVIAFLASEKGLAVLLSLASAVLLVASLQQLGYTRFLQRRWLEERRPHYAIASHFAAMQTAKLELAMDMDEALALVAQACHELGVHECRVSLLPPSTQERWSWSWAASASPENSEIGRADKVRLPLFKSHASWTLDFDDREPELDMNLRVIMSEFMEKALRRLCFFVTEKGKAGLAKMGKSDEMRISKLKGRL